MKKSNTLAYLPLKKFHIVPINGLSVDELKESANQVECDREKIKHTSLLNAIVKALGFKGGFAQFAKENEHDLNAFLKVHQMSKRTDLVTPRSTGYGLPIFKLNRQDISERFFFSGKSIPKKIFTGYDFPYEKHFDDGFFIFNSLADYRNMPLASRIKLAKEDPYRAIPTFSEKNDKRYLIDFILGSETITVLQPGFNLIGDQLTCPTKSSNYEICLYNRSKQKIEEDDELFTLFIDRLHKIGKGWVEIIPYNDNLIFLKGENGEYDFVFRNQRDKLFSHDSKFSPYLKRADIPKFASNYHFNRWFYFEYQGFRARDSHEAEKQFYSNGGDIKKYPDNLLKQYLYSHYQHTLCSLTSKQHIDGFVPIELSMGKKLMVSELISIKDFEVFRVENTEYFNNRKLPKDGEHLDSLVTANNECNADLPVALTAFDVLQYIAWFNKKFDVEARLLSLDEYQVISPFTFLSSGDVKQRFYKSSPESYCVFIDKNGYETQYPPYMEESTFQALTMKYVNPTFKEKQGISFMDSHFFAEWLKDFSCIRSNSLTSFYGDDIYRQKPPMSSTGRYKGIKIGFRLCYDAEA